MEIIINAKRHKWNTKRLAYSHAVQMALGALVPGVVPSVSFHHADQDPAEGIFHRRTSIKIKEGTTVSCHITGSA